MITIEIHAANFEIIRHKYNLIFQITETESLYLSCFGRGHNAECVYDSVRILISNLGDEQDPHS
jgi:hypothetical protein